jgi:hypothetical protein
LCSIDFTNARIGLCPKYWSTSPGTIVYDISKSKYSGDPGRFEGEYCPKQRTLKGQVEGVQRLASFKPSVNGQFGQRTSATYAQASPLYYEFSRYLNATIDVPVAVIRTMNTQKHYQRVASKGPALAKGTMIASGWKVVTEAEKNPPGYVPGNEFYYGDPANHLFYGAMLKGPGTRYAAEFNGNIAGKPYSEQYAYMQKTAPFLALSSAQHLTTAIDSGISSARQDVVVAKALGTSVSREQMVLWMQELSEMLILDYIFSQQDRPGNIDYVWTWYYVNPAGELKTTKSDSEASRTRMDTIGMPDEVKGSTRHFLLQKTHLNDNDAGGRRYSNFTKKFGLLEKIRHMNAASYRQLIHMANDFQQKGPLYGYLRDTFYMSDAYTQLIAGNTISAATILKNTCKQGNMRFDLDSSAYITSGKIDEKQVNCDNP